MSTPIPARLTEMSPQLLVSDLARSVDFYTTTLGFQVDFTYADFYAGLSRDGLRIHLKLGKTYQVEREYRRRNDHLDISFGVDGISELYDEMRDKQADIIQQLRDMPYGTEFYMADPDGYILGFLGQRTRENEHTTREEAP